MLAIDPPQRGPHPLIFAGGLVLGAILLYRWSSPLKRVKATQKGLLVSNYRQEIFVPYNQISSVCESWAIQPRRIRARLHSATPFGSSFIFIPHAAFVLFGGHPVATRLRERAQAARRGRS